MKLLKILLGVALGAVVTALVVKFKSKSEEENLEL